MNNYAQVPRTAAGTFIAVRKLALCLFALVLATAVFAGSQFSSIVVFGDSLCDTGRLFRLTHGGFPPRVAYFEGRQTNGPVWVEYLAARMGLEHHLKNYAVVGAMTGPGAGYLYTGNVWSDTYPGAVLEGTSVKGQLAQYLASTGGKVDPEALYIVEGGANDLINPLTQLLLNPPASQAEFAQDVQTIATPVVVNIATVAGTLKALGAQHIAIVNVPDFGKAPRIVHYGPQASAVVSYLVDSVNEAVGGQLDLLDAAGGNKFVRIDAYSFIDGVVESPAHFWFANVTDQFMTLDRATLTVTYASPHRCDSWKWFFWDELHPSTRGHEFFAEFALATLHAADPSPHSLHGACR
jgi:phospholipase/lecithinase/hemolysin